MTAPATGPGWDAAGWRVKRGIERCQERPQHRDAKDLQHEAGPDVGMHRERRDAIVGGQRQTLPPKLDDDQGGDAKPKARWPGC